MSNNLEFTDKAAQAAEKALAKTEKVKETALTKTTTEIPLIKKLNASRQEIENALAKRINTDQFIRIVTTAIRTNPKLNDCDASSFMAAVMTSAQLGLEPFTPLGEAYIIPYKNKATFQLGYKGLVKLVWQSGLIESMNVGIIKENDIYDYEMGTSGHIKHIPKINGDRGAAIAYYVIIKTITGGIMYNLISKDEATEHRNKFSQKDYNGQFSKAWRENFDSMAIKTAIINLSTYLPKRTTPEALMFERGINSDGKVMTGQDDLTSDSIIFSDYEVEVEEVNG